MILPPVIRRRRKIPPLAEREWRTAEELFTLTGMSEATINRHARGELEPKLPYIRIGSRKRVFLVAMVIEWREDLIRRTA